MKYLHQFMVIIGITFVGELLKYMLPLPIPASIYGMVIMFIGLMTGFIKLDSVKDVGKFLIEIMPVMFIPAGVGLMSSWHYHSCHYNNSNGCRRKDITVGYKKGQEVC